MKFRTTILLAMLSSTLSGCMLLPSVNVDKTGPDSQYHPKMTTINDSIIQQGAPEINNYNYLIGPQDELSIVVWSHTEFNNPSGDPNLVSNSQALTNQINYNTTETSSITTYLVDADGNIFFPLVGKIKVAGKTIDQVQTNLTQSLTRYIHNPQVTVKVSSFQSKRVYVMGEVTYPQMLMINNVPMTLQYAINQAGGINSSTANITKIYVIRGSNKTPSVYWLDESAPEALLLAESFPLKPDDVVYVSTAAVSQWNRVMTQLLPTTQTMYYGRSTPKNQPS